MHNRRNNKNIQITPTSFELMVTQASNYGETGERIGLRFNVHQGYGHMLDSFTFPLHHEDALELGALLIAHSDALAGRPTRDWDALTGSRV